MIHNSVLENWKIHTNRRLAICASLLSRHRLAREEHRPFLSCIVIDCEKWCLCANIRKRKEWLSPNRKPTHRTKTCAHPQSNFMLLVKQRGCACTTNCFPTADIYCEEMRCLASQSKKKNEQQDCVKWYYSTIMPARTQLTWQKILYRSWIEKSFRTHLITWSCALRFSPFPLSIELQWRNFLFGWKWAPNMAWRLPELKTTWFLQAPNQKITPALAYCCKLVNENTSWASIVNSLFCTFCFNTKV